MEAGPGTIARQELFSGRAGQVFEARPVFGWPFMPYRLGRRPLVAIGVAAAIIIIAALLMILGTREAAAPAAAVSGSFRLEATTEQSDANGDFRTVVVYERQDERHYRATLTSGSAGSPDVTSVIVADGEFLRFTDSANATVKRVPIPESSEAGEDALLNPMGLFSLRYGPLPRVRSMNELASLLSKETDYSDPENRPYARVVGDDTLLGIPVKILEYGPLWTDSDPDRRKAGWTIHSGGVGRAWIDPETMFILRNEASMREGQSSLVEVTSLEYDPVFAPGTFRFELPPGKVEVTE